MSGITAGDRVTRTRCWIAGVTSLIGSLMVGAYAMLLLQQRVDVFDVASLLLFAILILWISFSFVVATWGFVSRLRSGRRDDTAWREHAARRSMPGDHTCAVLVPVYNESPDDVFARIEAMACGLAKLPRSTAADGDGPGSATWNDVFDFYVLSDTTDPEIWLREEACWEALQDRLPPGASVYYRHRSKNVGRKAGNIADFCTRWGMPYPYMIVLDADSLMAASTMVQMVLRMDAEPRLGILQVAPAPVGRSSLLARLQQFSAAVYGPVFVDGFAAWAGDQGNYWGHNAIIRVSAFRECCDLPVLPGRAPLGGEILSHDFVEAALMVRAGWQVRLATDLDGSYEECPTTLSDYAQRDQRWCQGNLQHGRLLISEGFHPTSRLHFFSGIMAYVASPLWILLMITAVLGWSIQGEGPVTTSQDTILSNVVPTPDAWLGGHWFLFAVAMGMLLIPKAYGVIDIIAGGRADRFGGVIALVGSAVVETCWSILVSPIMAVLHTRFVWSTLRGRSIRWSAQQRSEHGVGLRDAARHYTFHTVLGLILIVLIGWSAGPLLLWFLPVVVGLVLAIPVAMIAGSRFVGMTLRRCGLLLIAQEVRPPDVLVEFDRAIAHPHARSSAPGDGLLHLLTDADSFDRHDRILTAAQADEPLAPDDRTRILSAAAADLRQIPDNLRRGLLSDRELLHQLHATRRPQAALR